MNRPFFILSPPYNPHSAGIRVLHTLCNELNLAGETAHLIFYKFGEDIGQQELFVSELDLVFSPELTAIKRLPEKMPSGQLEEMIQAGIVIYPEVIQGNPLLAKRVVRFVLNTPAINGYAMLEKPNDFIVSFSKNYWPNPNFVLPLLVDEPFFHDKGSQPAQLRTLDCTYFGKGSDLGECFKMPGTLKIERKWPGDKESLALLLRQTRYLFTWDVVSQTNYDAVRCGAIPIVMRWAPLTPEAMQTEIGEIPHGEIIIDNGQARIQLDPLSYELKRTTFLQNYQQLVESSGTRVRDLVIRLDQHFAGQS